MFDVGANYTKVFAYSRVYVKMWVHRRAMLPEGLKQEKIMKQSAIKQGESWVSKSDLEFLSASDYRKGLEKMVKDYPKAVDLKRLLVPGHTFTTTPYNTVIENLVEALTVSDVYLQRTCPRGPLGASIALELSVYPLGDDAMKDNEWNQVVGTVSVKYSTFGTKKKPLPFSMNVEVINYFFEKATTNKSELAVMAKRLLKVVKSKFKKVMTPLLEEARKMEKQEKQAEKELKKLESKKAKRVKKASAKKVKKAKKEYKKTLVSLETAPRATHGAFDTPMA